VLRRPGSNAHGSPIIRELGFSENSDEHTVLEWLGRTDTFKQRQLDPLVTMNWTLLDFGRRKAASQASLNRLIAVSLNFSRTI
jgi:hypothetical protein